MDFGSGATGSGAGWPVGPLRPSPRSPAEPRGDLPATRAGRRWDLQVPFIAPQPSRPSSPCPAVPSGDAEPGVGLPSGAGAIKAGNETPGRCIFIAL